MTEQQIIDIVKRLFPKLGDITYEQAAVIYDNLEALYTPPPEPKEANYELPVMRNKELDFDYVVEHLTLKAGNNKSDMVRVLSSMYDQGFFEPIQHIRNWLNFWSACFGNPDTFFRNYTKINSRAHEPEEAVFKAFYQRFSD